MDNIADVSRIARALGGVARRAADWVADSLTRSGEGRAAMWASFAEQHRPAPALPYSSRDRRDLQAMRRNDRFGPANLESAIRRNDDGSGRSDS
jgi:hypothetical protein